MFLKGQIKAVKSGRSKNRKRNITDELNMFSANQ